MSVVRALRPLFLALLLTLAALAPGAAEDTPRQQLDAAKTTIAEVDAALKAGDLSDGDLVRLRGEIDPLIPQLQALITNITPQLAASQKRLAELTPKSKDTAPANDAATPELAAEQKLHDGLDADLRSARAMLLQVDDIGGRIGAARRDLFARQTFARASSVFSPLLWSRVVHEAAQDFTTIGGLFADWFRGLAARMTRTQVLEFFGLMLALVAMAPPIRWITRRVIARDPTTTAPSRLKKALAAAWTIVVLSALPLAGLGVLAYAFDVFDISDPRLQPAFDALLDGLRMVALSHALARGLLAPGQSNWRLPDLGDRVARLMFRYTLVVSSIWAVERLLEPAADAVGSLDVAIAVRALGAALIALAVARALRRIADPAEFSTPPARDPWAPARTLAWTLVAVIFGATVLGYIAFATFLVNQTFFVVAIVTLLYLVDIIAQESTEALLRPGSPIGYGLMTMVGLRREALEQIVVLVQGLARFAAMVAGVALALGPLGWPQQDIVSTLRSAYFGFTVGGVTISLSSLLAAAILFVLGVLATRAVQNWLGERYLPRTRLDSGVSNSIRTIFGYIGVVVALLAGGSQLGLDLQKFALIAGALSVGIGFGLQGIVNNFVSGLILLWERGIRVGDWVVVGAEQGFVRRINARSTEIETFDRATLIVPNSSLVTGLVKNWMHSDRIGRVIVTVNAAYEADPEQVRELLIAAAKAQELVLSIPAPLVLLTEFGDWALKFQLFCYVDDVLMADRVKSELYFDVLRRMKEAGLKQPYPALTAVPPARSPSA